MIVYETIQGKFQKVFWNEVKNGEEVYLIGTWFGKLHFYGPHKIYKAEERQLGSHRSRYFTHYPEELAVKI